MVNYLRLLAQETGSYSALSSYCALYRPLQDFQSRAILVCGILLAIAAGAPLPIIGVIFAKVIDNFPLTEDEVRNRIWQLLAVAIAYFVVTWGYVFCWGVIGAQISRGLRTQMVNRALGLDQTYFETQCPDITSRLTADAQTVQSGTAEKVGIFIQSISYFVITFIVAFILNARLTGILFAAVIPSMILVIIIGTSILNHYSNRVLEGTSSAASIAEGAIKAVQVVQAFDAFESLTADHENHLTRAMKDGVKKANTGAIMLGSIFFIAYAANALAYWQGSKLVRNNISTGSAGTVYAIVFLILDASFVIGAAGPFIQSFSHAATAGNRIYSLIDYPDIPIDVYSQDGVRADDDTFGPNKEIIFSNVSFAYPARPEEIVLNSVNFEIKTGSTVGIVGASGSGKSTIAALLLRLYDPAQGQIQVDGHSIPEYNLSSFRNQIALVDQNPAVFSGTIYSNIKDGYKGAEISEDEMRGRCIKAAKAADAWSFIELLPNGLDTRLGEPSGTKLSGGQKQRVCLARALVADPALLVLDEATSALDTISEAAILTSLGTTRSMGNRTTVMIAHRLAPVRSADNIIVMGKGEILEQGDHESLLSRSEGVYRKLIEAQQFSSDDASEVSMLDKADLVVEATPGLDSDEDVMKVSDIKEVVSEAEIQTFGTFAILQRCLALSRSRAFFTCLGLVGSLTTGGLILGESIIFGHLVELLNGDVPSDRVNFFCLMFFVVALAALAGYTISGSSFGLVSEHLILRTRDLSLRTILRQDMEWFLQPGRSASLLTSVISMDAGHLSGLSGVIIGTIVSALVSVVGGAILAHIVAWKIAIVLFATSPVVILAGFFRFRILSKLEEKNQKAYTEAAALASEACSSIRTIAVLGIERETSQRFHLAVDKFKDQTFRHTALGNLLLAYTHSLMWSRYFVYALAYWWGARQVRSGENTTLQFFTVLPAILFSAQAAGQIFSLAPDIGRAKGAASRVFALHDQKPTIDIRSSIDAPRESIKLPPTPSKSMGNISFQNVTLAYRSRPDAPVFTNLNLDIKAGETVALVGRSGAGKTSTISLIERFYDPTSGSVLLDEVDIRSVPVSQHRARISLVAQDPDLFSGTVAFNVGLGARPGHKATDEEIIAACKAVGIHEFISSLPDGYNTQCGNNGSQLSGGQKQRVAIARAYIRDPEILLLDEATSALDTHSEQQIQRAIQLAAKKRTTIMIAHRLTSVMNADRILVFEKGKIVEEGRHEELMKGGGIYEQMVKAQSLG
ncbi:P-loop containing nucleoside triphosphate hydrolase protein [Mollisia scopiformis]|uniref:p-loop containing nucleoside triphosphate hydrolase protein n=1 Tax=Mollisia scopiformis TaxID=149040 RepID=A0A132B4T1_MOLSC|nr:P-loop containing nucleoside triphosphate hydrolase protein [Mollisia scopiformis]KUJ06999.1 P-loop containing nucleoside triphosphate hydrolase protein [Mollisia scopiformis]